MPTRRFNLDIGENTSIILFSVTLWVYLERGWHFFIKVVFLPPPALELAKFFCILPKEFLSISIVVMTLVGQWQSSHEKSDDYTVGGLRVSQMARVGCSNPKTPTKVRQLRYKRPLLLSCGLPQCLLEFTIRTRMRHLLHRLVPMAFFFDSHR